MTDVIVDEKVVETPDGQGVVRLDDLDEQLIGQLVDRARSEGLRLTGEDGLLAQVTKRIIESAAEGEMDDHLGYAKHDPAGRDGANSRNGARAKTVLTDIGPVEVTIPRDRDATFEPQIVRKRQRRLSGLDGLVISLSAKGLTHGEICAHLAEVYGATVSKQTISTITDRVIEGMSDWQNRPLDAVYPVVFIDAINVKIREGNVANRPIYVALGVTVDGTRDVLGLWAGEHGDGEGSKFWLRILTEIKNRGTQDICIVVCDGLKGLPAAIETVWPQAITQTCIIHLLRNSFRYASKRDWAAIAKDLKPVYTAASEAAALDAFVAFSEKWQQRYPGDHQAVGQRLGRVRALPGLRQGNPQRDLHDQQHREPELADPQGGERPRPLPDRAGRAQVHLSGDHEPRPDRQRPATLDESMEGPAQRLRAGLPRTTEPRPKVTVQQRVTPLS